MSQEMAPEETPDEGQVSTGQGPEMAPEETGQAEEPLLEYHFEGDDEPTRFQSADELKSFIRDGTLRHSDYTKKTQSVADERKKLESERDRFNNEYNEFLQSRGQIQKYNEFLNKNPQLKQQLSRMVAQPQGGQDPRVDELKEQFESLQKERDSEKKRQESDQAREKAFEALGKRFPDFNRKEVEALLGEFQQMPPGGEAEKMAELLHYANRGKKTPAQIEQEVASREEKAQGAHAPMTPGKQPGGGKKKEFSSIEEARAAAEKSYGG